MAAKYIIFDYNGIEVPVVFPDFIEHSAIKLMNGLCEMKPISAGFVTISCSDKVAYPQGQSVSLNLKSDKNDGEFIIKLVSP